MPRFSAYEACFLAGLKQLPIEGEAYRPFKILYSLSFADVRPTFVVDITAQYERRRKAILAFASQEARRILTQSFAVARAKSWLI